MASEMNSFLCKEKVPMAGIISCGNMSHFEGLCAMFNLCAMFCPCQSRLYSAS